MFDFVRKTRAPRRRQMHEHDAVRESFLYRLMHFHPRLTLALLLFVFSCTIAVFVIMQRATWDGQSQRGMLIVFGNDDDVQRSLAVVVVNGAEQKATALSLPRSLELESLRGYGFYRSSSLYGLASLERLPLTFVTQTISLQLGVDVSEIVWIRDQNTYVSGPRLANTFLSSLALQSKNSLSMVDRYRMWKFFSTLRKDQFNVIDLTSSSLIKSVGEASGEQRYQLDFVNLDTIMFELFSDQSIRKENISVAIVNTTGELRLGTRVARALSNMGVNVISVVSAGEPVEQTQLLSNEPTDATSQTAQLIERVLLLQKSQIKPDPAKSLEYRSDLVLMVGKDIARLYTGAQ